MTISKSGILAVMVILVPAVFLQAQAEECSSCHKARHGDAQCLNCHWNASTVSGRHTGAPYVPGSIHRGFDWEADDSNETNLPPDQESCPACHADMKDHTSQVVNTCVNCHVEGRYVPARTLLIRDNMSSLIPKVYSHYPSVNVTQRDASCFGFDAATGEGSCHGVGFMYRNKSGGYFAFNLNYTDVSIRSDIYHWTSSIDNLPASGDCIFCHKQENTVIRKAWGNPAPLPQEPPHTEAKNSECMDCHVDGVFESFHGKEVVRVKENSNLIKIGAGLLFVSVVIVTLYRRKQK